MNLLVSYPSPATYLHILNGPRYVSYSHTQNAHFHSFTLSHLHKSSASTAPMAAINQQTPQDNTKLIFTYGTLKRGFYNHALMEELMATLDASFVGEHTTVESFPLVIGPYGIPFLINLPGSGHRIPGELYSVTGRGLARLDELEGIETGHYERLPVNVVADGGGEVVAVEAYFAHRSFAEALWRKSGEKGLSGFSKEMGGKYVKRANRPLDSNFVDNVWKFISHS